RLRRLEIEGGWIAAPWISGGPPAWRWTSLRIGRLHVTDGHLARGARRPGRLSPVVHLHDVPASRVALSAGRTRSAGRLRGDVALAGGRARLRGRRDASGMRGAIEATALELHPLAPFLPAGVRSGRLSGRTFYRRSPDGAVARLDGAVAVAHLPMASGGGWRAAPGATRRGARHAALPPRVARLQTVSARDGEVVLADESRATPPERWTVNADVLSLQRVAIRRPARPGFPALVVTGLVARGVSTAGSPATVVARATVADAGRGRARGTRDLRRRAVEGRGQPPAAPP